MSADWRAFAGAALLRLALLKFIIGGPHSDETESPNFLPFLTTSSKTTPKRCRHIGLATVIST